MSRYWVYILATEKKGTLYIGVTNHITRRVYEHKEKMVEGFSQKYAIDKLVYAEEYADVREALYREKCLKKWNRAWKIKLIEGQNPNWDDLYGIVL
jgi:putative endonuclease